MKRLNTTFSEESQTEDHCGCSEVTGYGEDETSFREFFCVDCVHDTCFWSGLIHRHCRECGQVASHHDCFQRIQDKLKNTPKCEVLKQMEESKKRSLI